MSKKYTCDKCSREFNDPLQVTRINGKDFDLCTKCLKRFRKKIETTGKKFTEEK